MGFAGHLMPKILHIARSKWIREDGERISIYYISEQINES
jgi:hypothetical protein